jgi:CHAT domain-containing protein
VVSSYTPTLTALVHAQKGHGGSTDHESTSVLLVSLPDVSGLPSLPNARIEADLVRMATSVASTTTLTDGDASVANVMGSLPSASVLHLACHGHQSQEDPLASGFSLHDGRLTLERLMQLHLPHAELAYLSACETASTDEYQPDEAINLGATMLFVGFKSIIATMWCVTFTKYRELS